MYAMYCYVIKFWYSSKQCSCVQIHVPRPRWYAVVDQLLQLWAAIANNTAQGMEYNTARA